MNFSTLPAPLRLYLLAHAPALAVVLWAIALHPSPVNAPAAATLLFCALLFSTWKTELTVFQGRITPIFSVVCLAMLVQGAQVAVACATLGALAGSFVRPMTGFGRVQFLRPPLSVAFFNVANAALAAGAGALAFTAVVRALPLPDWAEVIGLAAFTSGYFAVNSLGVSRAIAWQKQLPWLAVWKEKFLWTGLGFFASASAAGGLHIGFQMAGARSLLFAPCLGLLFHWHRLYLDRVRLLEEKGELDRRHIEELSGLNRAIITSLATAIDAKDAYTCSHISRVQLYSVALGRAAGLEGPDLDAVATGALVHDIGKLGVPDNILGKPGKLTPEEYRRIQSHVEIGVEILSPIPFPFPVVPIVATHHERWDGLGYPKGLKGEEIPLGGRIIGIVDVFDALTSNRPYRRAMSREEALGILRDGAGKQFDPHLIELFIALLPEVSEQIARLEAEQREEAIREGSTADGNSALTRIGLATAEMAAAFEIAQAFGERKTPEQVIVLAVERVLGLLPADTAVLYLRDPLEPRLVAAAVEGRCRDKLLGMTIQIGEGVAGTVAETGQPQVNIPAALDVARRFKPGESLELSAATAVAVGEGPEPLGVLAVYTMAYSVLSEHHLGVLRIVAEHTAAALRRHQHGLPAAGDLGGRGSGAAPFAAPAPEPRETGSR